MKKRSLFWTALCTGTHTPDPADVCKRREQCARYIYKMVAESSGKSEAELQYVFNPSPSVRPDKGRTCPDHVDASVPPEWWEDVKDARAD